MRLPQHGRGAVPGGRGEPDPRARPIIAQPPRAEAPLTETDRKPVADGAGRESSRARMQAAPVPAPQLAGAIRAYVNLPPEKWLEQIEELRKQGKLEEAKTSLAEFKKRYPEYPLPASLKDGIKP